MREDSENFHFIEYREAANAYFKGVDIGFSTLRNYITMNALFATLIGISSDSRSPLIQEGSAFIKVVPIFAIFVSLLLAASFSYYSRHLNNCSRRCAEIEEGYNGKLFEQMTYITKTKKVFSAGLALNLIIILFILAWMFMGYQMGTHTLFQFPL